MNGHRTINLLLACAIAVAMSVIWDEPSEIEAAQAVSADAQDAIKSVATNEHVERATSEIQRETFAMVKP